MSDGKMNDIPGKDGQIHNNIMIVFCITINDYEEGFAKFLNYCVQKSPFIPEIVIERWFRDPGLIHNFLNTG